MQRGDINQTLNALHSVELAEFVDRSIFLENEVIDARSFASS